MTGKTVGKIVGGVGGAGGVGGVGGVGGLGSKGLQLPHDEIVRVGVSGTLVWTTGSG